MIPERKVHNEFLLEEARGVIERVFQDMHRDLDAKKEKLVQQVEKLLRSTPEDIEKDKAKEIIIKDIRTLLLSTRRTNNQPNAKPVAVSDAAIDILNEIQDIKKKRWPGRKNEKPHSRKEKCIIGILAEKMTTDSGVVQLEEMVERTGYSPQGIISGICGAKGLLYNVKKYEITGNKSTGWRLITKDPSEES